MKAKVSQPSSLQSQTSLGFQQRKGNPSKLGKGQPCQPRQPSTQSIDPSREKTSSPTSKASHEGLQKSQERRKTEGEGESEGENAECLLSASLGSHGLQSRTAVLARAERQSGRPGQRQGAALGLGPLQRGGCVPSAPFLLSTTTDPEYWKSSGNLGETMQQSHFSASHMGHRACTDPTGWLPIGGKKWAS